MPINNAGQMPSQIANTLINEGVVNNLSNQIKDLKDDKKGKTIDSKRALPELMESDDLEKTGTAILKGLIAKAFDSGIAQNVESKSGIKERGSTKEADDDKKEKDVISISTSGIKRQQKNIISRINLPQSLVRDFKGDTPQLVEQYAAAYQEYLIDNKPKSLEKLKKMEAALKAKGLNDEQIHTINKEIRNIARADLSMKIKESFVYRELSGSTIENAMHQSNILGLTDEAFGNQRLGGWNFGGYNRSLQGTVNRAGEKAVEEIDRFAQEELESRLMEKIINNNEDIKDLKELLDVSQKSSKNFNEWIKSIWPQKKEDLGFTLIDIPDKPQGNFVNTSSDNPKDRSDKKDSVIEETTEEKLLSNQLKAIYLERLLKGGSPIDIGVFFKIRKLKNGLIKLGVFSKDFDEKLKFEAETVAKGKIMDDLKEIVLERASLYQAKGPANDLLNKKLDTILKSAKKMGMEVTDEELKSMQDMANRRILDVLKKQIELYESLVKKQKNNQIEKELKKFKALEGKLLGETSDKIKEYEASEDMKSEIA